MGGHGGGDKDAAKEMYKKKSLFGFVVMTTAIGAMTFASRHRWTQLVIRDALTSQASDGVPKYAQTGQIDIVSGKDGKTILTVDVGAKDTILDVKKQHIRSKSYLYPTRMSYKLSLKDKPLSDDVTIGSFEQFTDGSVIYFKDLGPQIGWGTVFLAEYTGPIFIYLLFFLQPRLIYYDSASIPPLTFVQKLACCCWVGHYVKRVLETIFIHRFSKATMPVKNLFKNCSYYWGFAGSISYYINHPLYTQPGHGDMQILTGLSIFLFGELGNFSTHLAFKYMRPAGTKTRVIPRPNGNPFTLLFNLVSCPNYTYEIISWIGFTVLSQTFLAGLFTLAGGAQMAQWALGKHRAYKKEFSDYPKCRKSIIPFLL